MTERLHLLRSILEKPACDTVRLAYVDWLQENPTAIPKAEEHAAHIRWAVANPQNSWVCLCGCVGRKPNPCESCQLFGDVVCQIPGRKDRESRYVTNRGFVSELRMPADECVDSAIMRPLFEVTPITTVVPVGVVVDSTFHYSKGHVVRVHNVDQLVMRENVMLPVKMRSFLKGGKVHTEAYGDRSYTTAKGAHKAMSNAFVNWGRSLAKLKPINFLDPDLEFPA